MRRSRRGAGREAGGREGEVDRAIRAEVHGSEAGGDVTAIAAERVTVIEQLDVYIGRAVAGLGERLVLPPPNLGDWGLVGRDAELARLHELLDHRDDGAVVPITGLGGLGKTALAMGYVARFGEDYDLIAWIEAENPDLIPRQYRQLLRIRTGEEYVESDVVPAVRAFLARTPRWLLVFDNATNPDDLQPYLPVGPGRVLVTTRDETWSSNPSRTVAVERLPNPTVVAWLAEALDASETETDGPAVEGIAERLDGLPLAVVQAIAYVNARPGETAASYLDKLIRRDSQREVLAARKPPGYPAPVASTWDVAIDALTREAPAAVDLLTHLSYVSPTGMPLSALDGLLPDADVPGLLAELRRYGMVRTSRTHLDIHRLVQDVTRWTLTSEDEARYIERWGTHLRDRTPDPNDPSNFGWFADITPHVLALLEHAADQKILSADLATVANDTGISLGQQAAFASARTVLHHTLTMREALHGPSDIALVPVLLNLSSLHVELGQPRVAAIYRERAADIGRAGSGPADQPPDPAPDVVLAGSAYLGAMYGRTGNLHESLAHYRRALDAHDAADQQSNPVAVGRIHSDIAATYGQLGELDKAADHLQQALDLYEAAGKPDDLDIASVHNNLGNVHGELGRHHDAVHHLQRALEIKEAVLGLDHPEVAHTLTNLGLDQVELGEHRVAADHFQRALRIYEAAYESPDHPKVATTLVNLGLAYEGLGRRQDAAQQMQRALAIRMTVHGPGHPETVRAARHVQRLTTNRRERRQRRRSRR